MIPGESDPRVGEDAVIAEVFIALLAPRRGGLLLVARVADLDGGGRETVHHRGHRTPGTWGPLHDVGGGGHLGPRAIAVDVAGRPLFSVRQTAGRAGTRARPWGDDGGAEVEVWGRPDGLALGGLRRRSRPSVCFELFTGRGSRPRHRDRGGRKGAEGTWGRWDGSGWREGLGMSAGLWTGVSNPISSGLALGSGGRASSVG